MHIKMGLKLIEDWSARQATSKRLEGTTATAWEMIDVHVAPALCRLDVQAAFLMHSEAHTPPYDGLTQTKPPAIPTEFRHFSQARRLFDQASSFMFLVLGKKPEDCDVEGIAKARQVFESWSAAFSSLVARTHIRKGNSDDRAIHILRIYYNFARVVLDTHHAGDEMSFDKQTDRFKIIINQADELVHFPSTGLFKAPQPFSFDVSLASPLNFVGARCREPEIRRQAVSLLKIAEKSSWNCEHCALVIQYILELEEKGLEAVHGCEDVPSQHRIRRIMSEVFFEQEHIKITYVHHPYTKEMPINVAILPLRHPGGVVSTEGAVELDPVIPS
jgi:hypothetical protein